MALPNEEYLPQATDPRRVPRRPQQGVAGTVPTVMQQRTPVAQDGIADRPTTQPTAQTQPGGYASLQPYTATNNLRGTQIGPTQNPAVQQSQQQATDAYGRAQQGIAGTQATSPAAMQSRAMALGSLQSLQGPDRGAIATDVFQQMREASQPQFEEDLRNVGRDAARFGRLGAGMTTSRLGDVVSNRERDLSLAQRNLASEAAGLSLNDRLGVFNAGLGASGQFTNEDLSRAGFGLSRAGAEQSLGSSYQGLADQTFGQDFTGRQELRGERDFQNQMQQQALEDMIRQRTLEEMLLNGEWGRNQDYTGMLLGTGF